jgi:sugar phosphate isomerase/epimerase
MNFGRLSIVLSTHAAQFEAVALKGNLEANLEKIAAWGYSGVELAVRDPLIVDKRKLAEYLSNCGLVVPAIGTGQAWGEERLSLTSPEEKVRKAAIERLKQHFVLAAYLDSLVIIGLIRGMTQPGQAMTESMRYLIDGLQECCQAASSYNVRLAFEPLNRYETDLIHTVVDGMDLLNQVGSSNLGLLLDTFHMNIEEPDITDSILQADKRLFHFHVADSNRRYAGAGHLDFKSILLCLKSCSYNGWISGEFVPQPDAEIAARRNIAHLKDILNKIA